MINVVDDHSPYLLATLAGEAATTEFAWDVFELAASRYGLPRQVLSDNGLTFTGRLHQTEVAFERSLRELGVELITSAPYTPRPSASWSSSTAPSRNGSETKGPLGPPAPPGAPGRVPHAVSDISPVQTPALIPHVCNPFVKDPVQSHGRSGSRRANLKRRKGFGLVRPEGLEPPTF